VPFIAEVEACRADGPEGATGSLRFWLPLTACWGRSGTTRGEESSPRGLLLLPPGGVEAQEICRMGPITIDL